MKVSVVGQGYVGLPLALAIAKSGHKVFGIDTNLNHINKIKSGVSPILDISDAEIAHAQASGEYCAKSDFESIKESEVVIICVPTPLNVQNQPDLTHLVTATNSISTSLQPNTLVINESTVSPGTTRGLIKDVLDQAGVNYYLAYSPERVDPANKKWNVVNTPKLVAGIDEESELSALNFYRTFVNTVVMGTSLEVVETAKLLENSFRLINISFINEFAQFCSKINVSVLEVIDAASTKPYGFMPFYPSGGIGGHCIPIDPSYLSAKAKEVGVSSHFIDLAIDFNRSLPKYFIEIAKQQIGELRNKKILIVGIAYKPNVSDVRETPATGLVKGLRAEGALVSWHDDLVMKWEAEESTELGPDYDLIILLNPHDNTNLTLLGSARVLDTRGVQK